jgi:hypothetical protein
MSVSVNVTEAGGIEVVTLVASLSKAWDRDLEVVAQYFKGELDRLLGWRWSMLKTMLAFTRFMCQMPLRDTTMASIIQNNEHVWNLKDWNVKTASMVQEFHLIHPDAENWNIDCTLTYLQFAVQLQLHAPLHTHVPKEGFG